VDEVFQPHTVDVVENVSCNDFHFGEQKCWVQARVCEAGFYFPTRDADFMQYIAIGGDERIV
jgi:hypothetical protein